MRVRLPACRDHPGRRLGPHRTTSVRTTRAAQGSAQILEARRHNLFDRSPLLRLEPALELDQLQATVCRHQGLLRSGQLHLVARLPILQRATGACSLTVAAEKAKARQ